MQAFQPVPYPACYLYTDNSPSEQAFHIVKRYISKSIAFTWFLDKRQMKVLLSNHFYSIIISKKTRLTRNYLQTGIIHSK